MAECSIKAFSVLAALSALALCCTLVLGCTGDNITPGDYNNYTSFVIDSLEPDRTDLALRLRSHLDSADDFSKGDIYFMLWRMGEDDICSNLNYYEHVLATSKNCEVRGVVYETLASLSSECRLDFKKNLDNAKAEWGRCNMSWRNAVLDGKYGFENYSLPKLEAASLPNNAARMIIGASYIRIDADSRIGVQSERTVRDWLSGKIESSPFGVLFPEDIYTVFYEELSYNYTELRPDIGWHEGGRLKDMLNGSGAQATALSGTVVKKINSEWFAPDENGVFRFNVLPDKIENYPGTRYFGDDLAIMIDTHGISSLVEQALRDNVTFVMGCCDSTGKINAAHYLAERGIDVYCQTDMNVRELIGTKTNGTILGSAPIKQYENYAIIGDHPMEILLDETIVAESTSMYGSIRYYETPYLYFSKVAETYDLKMDIMSVEVADLGQTQKLVDAAIENDAHVIGARVYNHADYAPLHDWLESDENNRLVLFHSIAYPYGDLLFTEFPSQTSFGDINIIFE